jgi:hypothetical protein
MQKQNQIESDKLPWWYAVGICSIVWVIGWLCLNIWDELVLLGWWE